MNTIYKTWFLLLIILSSGVVACNDDEDEKGELFPEITESQPIELDSEIADVFVGGTSVVKITKGGGDYKVVSLNPSIAEISYENSQISVTGLKMGRSAILITDANSQYKTLEVVSHYNQIILEQNSVVVGMKLGHVTTVKIDIIQGNGDYKCSSQTEIFDTWIEENQLIIEAREEGTATVTITDDYGLKIEVPVTVQTTTIPYSEDELVEIMNDSSIRYVFNEQKNSSWVTVVNRVEEDLNVRGYTYYTYMSLLVYYPGDHYVGKKTGAELSYQYAWGDDPAFEHHSCDFEIIKNDGEKVWAIYSFVENERLYFGHFCAKL